MDGITFLLHVKQLNTDLMIFKGEERKNSFTRKIYFPQIFTTEV